jgi:hypothetical protein
MFSMLTRFRRKHYSAALSVCMTLMVVLAFVQIPAIAQPLGQAVVGVDTTFNIAPILIAVAQILAVAVLVAGVWLINGKVKDQNQRTALLGGLEKAVSFGINAVNGATKDKTLSINVGSTVVATALRYLQQFVPDAMNHFGMDEKSAAKALFARLPGVDGTVTDATFEQIVAAAHGTAPNFSVADAGVSAAAIADAILQHINKAKSAAAEPAPSPAATHVTPPVQPAPPPV